MKTISVHRCKRRIHNTKFDNRPKTLEEFLDRSGFKPHKETQWQVMIHPARFKILAAGARFGKSMLAGAIVAWTLLQDNKRIWIVGPTYQLALKEFTWAMEFLHNCGFGPDKALKFSNPTNGSSHIEFPWKSFCTTKSADKPSSCLGEELDLLIIAEGPNIAERVYTRYLRARLGPRNGDMLIPATPAGDNFVFDMYKKGQDEEEPEWMSWQFRVIDNPHSISQEEYEKAKRELPESIFAEQYDGKFCPAHGRVYPELESDTHVIDVMPKGWEDWPKIYAIDFGYTNPFACIWIAISPDLEYYVYDELYGSKVIVEKWAPKILEKNKGHRILYGVSDHDAEDRATLHEHGVRTTKACKNLPMFVGGGEHRGVRRTIQVVKALLMKRDNGRPRLFFLRKCKNCIREMINYRWPESKEDRAESELPLKVDDHCPDALRYGVFSLEKKYNWGYWKRLWSA